MMFDFLWFVLVHQPAEKIFNFFSAGNSPKKGSKIFFTCYSEFVCCSTILDVCIPNSLLCNGISIKYNFVLKVFLSCWPCLGSHFLYF
jgi:hypothetical protein